MVLGIFYGFGASGVKLHVRVLLAATFEHFIHDEATDRLWLSTMRLIYR